MLILIFPSAIGSTNPAAAIDYTSLTV